MPYRQCSDEAIMTNKNTWSAFGLISKILDTCYPNQPATASNPVGTALFISVINFLVFKYTTDITVMEAVKIRDEKE